MYMPKHFEETRTEVLHAWMRKHSFATLVRRGPDGLVADHLPFLVDRSEERRVGKECRL